MSMSPTDSGSRERILLVDDTPTNLQVLFQTLEGQNFDLLIAQSGEEALEIAAEARPSLVLLDIMMPGIDGYETCRKLKANPKTRDAAVIFMSALDDTADKVRGLDAGAVDYITKPFQAAEVIARVRTHLEMRRLHRELMRANQKMKQDLASAARVQQALLPTKAPEISGYNFAWRYRPCDELAGDSLNVFPLRDNQIGAYVLDVSGHGVAASLLAVSVTQSMVPRDGGQSVVNDPEGGVNQPAAVASRLNDRYPMEGQAGHYFTLAYGILEPDSGRFRYICAGHPGPVIIRSESVESTDGPSFPIGIFHPSDYFESVAELAPGDRLYLYSDGIYEEIGTDGSQFGRKRLNDILYEARKLSLEQSIYRLIESVVSFHGNESLTDDVTVLAIERGK